MHRVDIKCNRVVKQPRTDDNDEDDEFTPPPARPPPPPAAADPSSLVFSPNLFFREIILKSYA